MQRLAPACLVGPGPYPTVLALMAHYDRRPKKTQWARLVESEEMHNRDLSDSQPDHADGLPTPLTPTMDAGELAGVRTTVEAKGGHQTGHVHD